MPPDDALLHRVSRRKGAGFMSVLRIAATTAMLVGAAGSVPLMLHAGRRQQSRVLLLLFGTWVLSPFLGAGVASSISKRWGAATRTALYAAIIVFALSSLAIYGAVAFGYVQAKVGFVFLVAPLVSWLLLATGVGTSALISRRQSSRQNAA
jgi:hypothetical protein